MSQNINNFVQAPQNGYKWELSSLKRHVLRQRGPSPMDMLPLKRIPILKWNSHYVVEFKGVWQGEPQEWKNARMPKVTLKSQPPFQQSENQQSENCFRLGNVKWLAVNSRARIQVIIKPTNCATMPQWRLCVDGQLVLQNLRVLTSDARFRYLVSKAHKQWKIYKQWQNNQWKSNQWGIGFEEGNPLYFSLPLKRECEQNTELWQGLVMQAACWAKTRNSKRAQSIRANLAIATSLPSVTSVPSSVFPTTNELRSTPDTIQPRSQLNSANHSQSLDNQHRMIDTQPASASQIAYPSMGQFNSYSALSQTGKRKRVPSTTTTNPQNRRRTHRLAPFSTTLPNDLLKTSSIQRSFYVPSIQTFSLSPAAAPQAYPGATPAPAQKNSVTPIQPPVVSEDYISEREIQQLFQANSVDPLNDQTSYITEAEMRSLLQEKNDQASYITETEMRSLLQENLVEPPQRLTGEKQPSNPQSVIDTQTIPSAVTPTGPSTTPTPSIERNTAPTASTSTSSGLKSNSEIQSLFQSLANKYS